VDAAADRTSEGEYEPFIEIATAANSTTCSAGEEEADRPMTTTIFRPIGL
jgi:hypothetical protein